MLWITSLLIPLIEAQAQAIPDPFLWASLIQRRTCELPKPAERRCNYAGTPLNAEISWTCTAGNFCPTPSTIQNCTSGFYCPDNAMQAVLCPAGFVCSPDTKTIQICPEGYFCPVGTTVPKTCGGILARCPEGSIDAPKFLLILVFGIIALAIYFLYLWKDGADLIREKKRKNELREAAIMARLEDKPDVKALDRTFTIEFQDLGLKLPNGLNIVSDISGVLRSGRTCAIMGPSGSGKTTVVTLLTGKQPRTSGTVKINGVEDELSNYSKLIGYVPQEDIMIRELTVRDILMHSARMRLPSNWDYQRVKKKVNEIISSLGMSHVANSVIGDEEERGISGGQRKRVNIGMELVAEPSVLFLDEPTSGLDSSTAFDVCANLRSIARQQGLTVAAVIHSPSPATFREFDDLLLLGKGGRVVFMGPREKAFEYFKACGFTCPADESQSDFFMDVVSGLVASEFDPAFKPVDLFDYWSNRKVNRFYYTKRMTRQEADLARKNHYRSHGQGTVLRRGTTMRLRVQESLGFTHHLKASFVSIVKNVWNYSADLIGEFGMFIASFFINESKTRKTKSGFVQTYFLMKRAYHQVYRNVGATIVDLVLNFTAGVFISIAVQNFGFIGADAQGMCAIGSVNMISRCLKPQDTLREAGMFICLGALFSGISIAGNTFGREKVVFWRDTAAGMSAIPYFVAKVLVDVPRIILGSTVYSFALVMFFKYSQSFVTLYWIVLCLHFYSFALGYALSTVVSYANYSIYGTGFSLLWALVLSGVLPDLKDIFGEVAGDPSYPQVISWLWTASGSRWAIEAFYISEIKALPFIENTKKPPFPYSYDNFGPATGYIWLITLVWLVLALLGLKLFNRSKQK